jgi:predicted dehydrogenase
MDKVNWGIVGVGDVTEVKSGPAFNKVKNSQILSVMRRNIGKAEDYAKRHGIPHFTNDASDIFINPEINAVYIATPPSSHHEYAIQAAISKKHIYVEKPMAVNYDACQAMIQASKDNSVKLFVAYYRRELDYFKKIKEIIESNILGRIKFVDIKLLLPPNESDYDKNNLGWRVIPEIAGAGYFYDLASHQFDFLDYLFGPVKSASGNSINQLGLYEAEDTVSASYIFESGIIGSGTWSFTMTGDEKIDSTVIYGEKGRISFSYFTPSPIELVTSEDSRNIEIPYPEHVQQQLISEVVKDILGEGKCVSTGESGARTNWVMDRILGKL